MSRWRRARSGSARCRARSRRRSADAPAHVRRDSKTPGKAGNTRSGRCRTAGTFRTGPVAPIAVPCRRAGATQRHSRTAPAPGRPAVAARGSVGRAGRGCSGWCHQGPSATRERGTPRSRRRPCRRGRCVRRGAGSDPTANATRRTRRGRPPDPRRSTAAVGPRPAGNSADQPIMNQPVTFQVNGTFTQPPLESMDTKLITV